MSGPRFSNWHHVRVIGDRDVAQAYFPQARKVLGHVWDEAQRNQLGVATRRVALQDGTVIIADKIGNMPRITIDVTGRARGGPPERGRDRFVVWARDIDRQNGIGETTDLDGALPRHPQQMLEKSPDWATRFFNAGSIGFDEFALRKGVYERIKGRGAFPDGVRRAGNIDWEDRRGYRINWYGPSTRYFLDPYVQPQLQYRPFVFMLGEPVLDVDAYITSSTETPMTEKFVMGACIRVVNGINWLYTIQADLPVMSTPGGTINPEAIFLSEMYPLGSIPLRMNRYALTRIKAPDEVIRFKVIADSRQSLWFSSIERAAQPWFFNQNGTEASSFATKGGLAASFRVSDSFNSPPGDQDSRLLLTILSTGDGATLSESPASLPAGGGLTDGILATDYVKNVRSDLKIVRRIVGDTRDAPAIKLDDLIVPLIYHENVELNSSGMKVGPSNAGGYTNDPIPNVSPPLHHTVVTKRYLVFADIPSKVLLFAVNKTTLNFRHVNEDDSIGTFGFDTKIELYRNGLLVASFPTSTPNKPMLSAFPADEFQMFNIANGTGEAFIGQQGNFVFTTMLSKLAVNNIAPSFYVYGAIANINEPSFSIIWMGFHGVYGYLAYPEGHIYGSFAVATTGSGAVPVTNVAEYLRSGGFSGSQGDKDGMVSTVGCATIDDVTMFSIPPYYSEVDGGLNVIGESDNSIFYVDGDKTLGALTGVAGQNSRYHPIWRLGRLDLPGIDGA
jgi:hypothetical protein